MMSNNSVEKRFNYFFNFFNLITIESFIIDLVSLQIRILTKWGLSSAGRALPLHGRGREFDPPRLHQI